MKRNLSMPLPDGKGLQIIDFNYNGQAVLTTKQLIQQFKCKENVIRKNLYRHKGEFIEGVDYFTLKDEPLLEFKAAIRRRISEMLYVPDSNENANVTREDVAAELENLIKGPSLCLAFLNIHD